MDTDQILLALAVVIAAALVARGVAQRLSLGPIVALLAVGAALGPHSPYPLLGDHVDELKAVGEVGVVLLLFLVGLDTRPELLRSMRRQVFGSAVVLFLLTAGALAAVFALLAFEPWQAALVVGLGLAMSSGAVALAALEERGEQATARGRAVTAVLIAQGFIAVPVLAAIPLLAAGPGAPPALPSFEELSKVLGALAAVYAVGRFVLPWVLAWCARTLGPNAFSLAILAATFAAAWLMDVVGASMALGSLMVGMLLSRSPFAPQIRISVGSRKALLLGVLFIAIGMSIDPHQVAGLGWELVAVLPLLLLIKVAALAALAPLFGLRSRTALLAGLLVAPLDEIGFVIFASAHHLGLLHAQGYALSLTLISFSFLISPPLINLGYALEGRLRRGAPAAQSPSASPDAPVRWSGDAAGQGLADAVVVVGYGQAGRVICTLLDRAGIRFIAFDLDLDRVAIGHGSGHAVHYGDLTNPEMLAAVSIGRARAVVVTTPDDDQTRSVIGNLRAFHPEVPVMTAVHELLQRDELRRLGVPGAVALMPEGVLNFGALVLARLGVAPDEIERQGKALRADDYALLREAGGAGG